MDDAVVVNDNIERRLQIGESPFEASVNGSNEALHSIVSATLVLIEFIENERNYNGINIRQAVINTGEARLRPVLLTAATAISGLLSLALSGDVLFAPLAIHKEKRRAMVVARSVSNAIK